MMLALSAICQTNNFQQRRSANSLCHVLCDTEIVSSVTQQLLKDCVLILRIASKKESVAKWSVESIFKHRSTCNKYVIDKLYQVCKLSISMMEILLRSLISTV